MTQFECLNDQKNLPLTFEKSKSFRSIDGDGRILSGPFIAWLEYCWLWLPTPLLFIVPSLWWLDFSLTGDGETLEFELALELDEFNSADALMCSLFDVLWTGVLELGRECCESATGLRWLSLKRLGDDPESSFFGVLGRVNANACVWK